MARIRRTLTPEWASWEQVVLHYIVDCHSMGRFAERPPERRFDGRNENHPAPRLLRGPVRRRLDHQEVRLRRRCPPARDFEEDDQETSLPSRQEFCRREIYGRSGEAVTIGILLAFPICPPCVKLRPNPAQPVGMAESDMNKSSWQKPASLHTDGCDEKYRRFDRG